MIKIKFKNKIYIIPKDNIIFVLEKLSNRRVEENEIENLIKKYKLYDEYFLQKLSEQPERS